MKNILWNLMAGGARLLPEGARRRMVRLMAAAAAARPDARAALRELFGNIEALEADLDQTAIRYEGGLHPKHRLMDYHRFFIGKARPGERILDLGCGMGAVAHSLAVAGMKVMAVDVSEENIKTARERWRHNNLSFEVCDATKTVPPGPYPTVVLSNVLEHIEDRHSFLGKVVALAKPERLLIRVPMSNRDWTVPLKKELGLFSFSDPTHFTEYTRESFAQEMKAAGLAVAGIDCVWGEIWAEVRPCPE